MIEYRLFDKSGMFEVIQNIVGAYDAVEAWGSACPPCDKRAWQTVSGNRGTCRDA